MNYRRRANKTIARAFGRALKSEPIPPADRGMVQCNARALVEEIAWQLRRAEFEGARRATLAACRAVGEVLIDNRPAVEQIIERAYIPKALK